MKSLTKYAMANIATAAFVAAGLTYCTRPSDIFDNASKTRTCRDQAVLKVAEGDIPANGKTTHDTTSDQCVYAYTDNNGQDAKLSWAP